MFVIVGNNLIKNQIDLSHQLSCSDFRGIFTSCINHRRLLSVDSTHKVFRVNLTNMPELVGNYDQTEFERSSFSYADMSSVFHLKDVNYTRQFAHIYAHRLVQMRGILSMKVQQKWGINIK